MLKFNAKNDPKTYYLESPWLINSGSAESNQPMVVTWIDEEEGIPRAVTFTLGKVREYLMNGDWVRII